MDKPNVFRTSEFYLSEGDILHVELIDESGDPITIELADAESGDIVGSTPQPPLVQIGSAQAAGLFTANWMPSPGADSYRLDVATDEAFTSIIAGKEDINVGNVTSYPVTGLAGYHPFFYRLRAVNANGTSANSNIADSILWYQDLYIPSSGEMTLIYDNVASLNPDYWPSSGQMWTSTEVDATNAYVINFPAGGITAALKDAAGVVSIPCRTFISNVAYSLRDTTPEGGIIFHVIDNLNGSYTYYEVFVLLQTTFETWSDVTAVEVTGTGADVGDGASNNALITDQLGSTDGAAFWAASLVVTVPLITYL
jgi:hypothetical protein